MLLIPIASSMTWIYNTKLMLLLTHANRYKSFHQQLFCEDIFCFQKEVTSFYRNNSLRNSKNAYLSVNSM